MTRACRDNGTAGNPVSHKSHHLLIAQSAGSHDDTHVVMLLSVFHDLIKPQWRAVIEELKRSGGLPASDLARALGNSYMATKTHCEELTELGYVIRTRLPRAEVGRPEIFYSLSSKAEALFPQSSAEFTLELLENVKRMFGESAPEKLLFQHFQQLKEDWQQALAKLTTITEKATRLAKIRTQAGYASEFKPANDSSGQLVEYHNPLHAIFERYPRTAVLEQRMLEEVLSARVTRNSIEGGRESTPRIVFDIH